MDGCVYRTKDGECDLYSEGGKFKAFCDPEHCNNIAPTNADRIRAMTDEELAAFLSNLSSDGCEYGGCPARDGYEAFSDKTCKEQMKKWLKREATE